MCLRQIVLALSLVLGHGLVSRPLARPAAAAAAAYRARLQLLEPGTDLPLPPALEAVPSSYVSLGELASGQKLLVLASSEASTMTDPLRTVLVGLQAVVQPDEHRAAVAAVSLVGAATYRKLARKAGVSYTLLCDSGNGEWLSQLHDGSAAAAGEVVVHIVAMPAARVLARFSTGGGSSAQDVVDAVGTALGQGREHLEVEVDTAVQARSAQADLAALRAENERLQKELVATAGKRLAEARVAARAEERRRLQEEADAANAASAARAAAAEAEARAGVEAKRARAAQQQASAGGSKVAQEQLRAAQRQAEQRRATQRVAPKAGRPASAAAAAEAEPAVAERTAPKARRPASRSTAAAAEETAAAAASAEKAATAVVDSASDRDEATDDAMIDAIAAAADAAAAAAGAGPICTLRAACSFEVVVQKSRFIAHAAPATSAEAANAWVKATSDARARHNCFAWRLSADGATRTNGDGEPGGTAGPPILAAIEGAGLHDVAVLVCRYRLDGGAKLGTGGLVRAYGGAAAAVLAEGDVVATTPTLTLRVRVEARDVGVAYAALSSYSPRAADDGAAEYGEEGATSALLVDVPPDESVQLVRSLREATGGRAEVRVGAGGAG